MEKVAPILLFGLGLAVAYFSTLYVRSRYFSRPKTFSYGEEVFIWLPDKGEGLPFFRKNYEHGSIQYADGTPVTDHRPHRMLQESWVRQNQPHLPEYAVWKGRGARSGPSSLGATGLRASA